MARGGSAEGGIILIALIGIILYYAAIAIGIACLSAAVLLGLFFLIREIYVGNAESNETDPLFSKASRFLYKRKNYELPVSEIKVKYAMSDQQYDYIIDQMVLAEILKYSDGIYSRNLKNIWALGPIFRAISRDEDYFGHQISQIAYNKRDILDSQLQNEPDTKIQSVLTTFRDTCEYSINLAHLYIQERYFTSIGQIDKADAIQKEILAHENALMSKSQNLQCEQSVQKCYNHLLSSAYQLNNTGLWNNNSKSRIKVKESAEIPFLINGQKCDIPLFEIDGYSIYLLPNFIVEIDEQLRDKYVNVIMWDIISSAETPTTYVKENCDWFNSNEADFSYTTWLYTKVNGGPDLRYSYNPSYSYYSFREISLLNTHILVLCGSSKISTSFVVAVNDIVSCNGRSLSNDMSKSASGSFMPESDVF